ncbi:uncharacterized protein LOC124203012 isoform X1 [Daphnia pulex]|uniref:uncharacterized protein LOC124203012 isoform X1 n=1 Tax=Daphnia pulex TaxID=6669 RepID=UPI001EDE920A|nr:uncharacterized protein LOC124203012 isoform X1 [Daphnia pulex]
MDVCVWVESRLRAREQLLLADVGSDAEQQDPSCRHFLMEWMNFPPHTSRMTAALSPSSITTRRIATSTFWLSGQDQQQHCVDSSLTTSDPVQCLKLLRELNGQVSAYHQLATSLGTSSGDGQNLRGRLKRTRRRARQLASIVRRLILTLDNNVGGESSGRLWCLLYCCLYVLALEMQRTLQLQCTFALYPAAGFINTGLVVVQQQQMKPANKQQQKKQKKKKPKASNNNRTNNRRLQNHMESSCLVDDDDDVPLADLLSLERAEINQLQQEIEELEGALQELRTNYNVVEIESYLTMTDPLERLGCDSASSAVCQQHNRSIINNQTTTTSTTTTTCYYYNSNDSGGASGGYCNVADDSIGSLSSSSSYHEEEEEEEEEDSSSVVNQRRCLCVVMAIVIIVFILATILGASL